MKSSTVNISFNEELLKKIDQTAKEESRSRSELIREAAREYIERKLKWQRVFDLGRIKAETQGITETDIKEEIAAYRKEKRSR
jgi:CopG family transcriptional regulator/antitoxin EndoAI